MLAHDVTMFTHHRTNTGSPRHISLKKYQHKHFDICIHKICLRRLLLLFFCCCCCDIFFFLLLYSFYVDRNKKL